MTPPKRQSQDQEKELQQQAMDAWILNAWDMVWKDSVPDLASLPLTGNDVDDYRIVLADWLPRRRIWSAWVKINIIFPDGIPSPWDASGWVLPTVVAGTPDRRVISVGGTLPAPIWAVNPSDFIIRDGTDWTHIPNPAYQILSYNPITREVLLTTGQSISITTLISDALIIAEIIDPLNRTTGVYTGSVVGITEWQYYYDWSYYYTFDGTTLFRIDTHAIDLQVDTTYDALMTSISTSTLVPWTKYRITDYATSNNTLAITPDVNTATVEPLIVTALGVNKISSEAHSESRPQDIIHFDSYQNLVPDYDDYRDAEREDGAQVYGTGLNINVTWPHTFTIDTGIILNSNFYIFAEDSSGAQYEWGAGDYQTSFQFEQIWPSLYQVTIPSSVDLTDLTYNYISFGQNASLGDRTWWITYRKDTNNMIETYFDFVGAKIAWYDPDYSTVEYDKNAVYNRRDVVYYSWNLYVCMRNWTEWEQPDWSSDYWLLFYNYSMWYKRLSTDWDNSFNTSLSLDEATRENYRIFTLDSGWEKSFWTGISHNVTIEKQDEYEVPSLVFMLLWGGEIEWIFSSLSYASFFHGTCKDNKLTTYQNVVSVSPIENNIWNVLNHCFIWNWLSYNTFDTFQSICNTSMISNNNFTTLYHLYTKGAFSNNFSVVQTSEIYNIWTMYGNKFLWDTQNIEIQDSWIALQNNLFNGRLSYMVLSTSWTIQNCIFWHTTQKINITACNRNGAVFNWLLQYTDFTSSIFTNTQFGNITWSSSALADYTTFTSCTFTNSDIISGKRSNGKDVWNSVVMDGMTIKGTSRGNTFNAGTYSNNQWLGSVYNSVFSGTQQYWFVTWILNGTFWSGCSYNTVSWTISGTHAWPFEHNNIVGSLACNTLWAFQYNDIFGVCSGTTAWPGGSFYNVVYNGLNNITFDPARQVIYNEFRSVPNGTNFSASTLIYANYPTPMEVNSVWTSRIKYLDGSDNYVFNSITA